MDLFGALSAAGLIVLDLTDVLRRNPDVPWYGERDLAKIDRIIVHHTAGSMIDTWSAINAYHIREHNWPGVAYTIGVSPNGTISLLGDLVEWRGATATADANEHGVQVCCIGNYEIEQPSAEMIAALYTVCRVLKEFLGRGLLVMGHRDVDATACPGKYLYAQLADVSA
jgi:N-acetylmuramoyl-L-alanine amidase